jgi:Conjugative transposon protein TcpC
MQSDADTVITPDADKAFGSAALPPPAPQPEASGQSGMVDQPSLWARTTTQVSRFFLHLSFWLRRLAIPVLLLAAAYLLLALAREHSHQTQAQKQLAAYSRPVARPADAGYCQQSRDLVRDYMTYDQKNPADWQARLSIYGIAGAADLQWNSTGSGAVQSTSCIDVQYDPADKDLGYVNVRVTTASSTYNMGVALARRASGWEFRSWPVFVASPAFVAPTSQATSSDIGSTDRTLSDSLTDRATGFFKAYSSGSEEAKLYIAQAAVLEPLHASYSFDRLVSFDISTDGGNTRWSRSVVSWKLAEGSSFTQTYYFRWQLEATRWFVVPPMLPAPSSFTTDLEPGK